MNTRLERFQSFLNKIADLSARAFISKQTYAKHRYIAELNPFPEVLNPQTHGDFIRLSISEVVINNIIGMHVLLLNLPPQDKKYLVANHKKLFIAALEDFYVDNYNYEMLQNYRRDLMIDKMDPEYVDILGEFIDQNIKLEYNAKDLQRKLVEYSILGFEESTVNHERLQKEFYHQWREQGVFAASMNSLSFSNKSNGVSYGNSLEINLIRLMEQAAYANVRVLQSAEVNSNIYKQMNATWQDLYNQQFVEFKKISRIKWGHAPQNFMIFLLVATGLLLMIGPHIIVLTLIMLGCMKFAIDAKQAYYFSRIILPQYRKKTDVTDRDALLASLQNEYRCKQKRVNISESVIGEKEQKTASVTIYVYESFPETTSQPTISRKALPKKQSSAKHSIQKQLSLRTPAVRQVTPVAPLPWLTASGDIFSPPAQCYKIAANHKRPVEGYLTPDAFFRVTQNLGKKKKQRFKQNIARLFNVVSPVDSEGIVLFNKEARKKFNAHSKIKFKAKELATFRIWGVVVAKRADGTKLVAYYDADQPNHLKQSI